MHANSEQLYKHNHGNKAASRTGKILNKADKITNNTCMITNKCNLVRSGIKRVRSNKIHAEYLSGQNLSTTQVGDTTFMPSRKIRWILVRKSRNRTDRTISSQSGWYHAMPFP